MTLKVFQFNKKYIIPTACYKMYQNDLQYDPSSLSLVINVKPYKTKMRAVSVVNRVYMCSTSILYETSLNQTHINLNPDIIQAELCLKSSPHWN